MVRKILLPLCVAAVAAALTAVLGGSEVGQTGAVWSVSDTVPLGSICVGSPQPEGSIATSPDACTEGQ